ncbi:MAG: extracellular solute-binding protein [Thaumarchaeota archaeon]|nr:extracellular solute-binding protein [Nitrososphaerota archaeon]
MENNSIPRSVRKSALTTMAAVTLTAILVASVVGGAGYVYSTQTDAIVAELKSDNGKLSSQVRTSQDETVKLNSRIVAVQDEGKKLMSDNDRLNSQIRTVEEDNGRLKSQLSSLSADLKAVADAAGIPLGNAEAMRKIINERKVIETANQEGKVVVYSVIDTRTMESLIRTFEKRNPSITVELVRGTGPALTTRFFSEFEKGVKSTDVLMLGQALLGNVLEKGQLLAKYVPKDTEWIPVEQKDREGKWTAFGVSTFSIAYNTRIVSKDEIPKTLRDLVDPKWKGKIASVNPKSLPEFVDIYMAMEKLYGETFMKQLAAQNMRYYSTTGEALDKLANGESSIALVSIVFVEPRKQSGQAVDWVRTGDNTYIISLPWTGITANAPHPNAAKLWEDFLLSKEAQQILVDNGALSLMSGIRLANPDLGFQGKKLILIEALSDAARKTFLDKYTALTP